MSLQRNLLGTRLLVFLSMLFVGFVVNAFADSDQYVLTEGYYSETADLDAIVQQEFGPGAEVADWADVKATFSDDIEAFCDDVGLVNYRDNAMCYRDGQAWWSGGRHYFLERHEHNVPSGWLVHDHIDNHFLDLGSWYGLNMRILVKLPPPTLSMREPWVENDDVHTGPLGVDSLRLLWSEPILFDHADISITNEDAESVPFSVSESNSQFMTIAFGETLLHDQYTITISDTVVSAETGAAIDGDNDGVAGGDAVLTMEHRDRLDHNGDNAIDLSDLAELLSIYGTIFE